MMKFINNLILNLIIVLVVSSGCKKEEDEKPACSSECLVLRGNIYTDDGSVGLSGIKIKASWIGDIGFFGADSRNLGEVNTNTQGFYEIKTKLRNSELDNGKIAIELLANDGYFFDCSYLNSPVINIFSGLKNDTLIHRDYLAPRMAYFHAKATGMENLKDGDSYSIDAISRFGEGAPKGTACISSFISWNNKRTKQEFDIEIAANQSVILEHTERINDINHKWYDTVFVMPGKTLEYIAKYE